MRIDEFLRHPRYCTRHRDPELLVQLAFERRKRRLTDLELAAGKFPISGVRLAGGTLRKQYATIVPHDDCGCDANDLAHFKRRAPA